LNSIAKQPTSSESDLSGSIPAELGNLTSLTALGLEDNKLSGDEDFLAIVSVICGAKECNCVFHYSSRTACKDSALHYMIEYAEIAYHIHINDLHLNLICQGPFRRNWVT